MLPGWARRTDGATRAARNGITDSGLYSAAVESAPRDVRYRCNACGNLTRFDVVRRAWTRAFVHFSLGGEPTVEQEEVLDSTIERVECRWCGSADQIETISRVSVEEQPS